MYKESSVDLKGITPEAALGGVGGLSMLWLFFKKVMLRTAVDNTAIHAADAESDVIKLLREEVNRLADSNSKLAAKMNALREENIALKEEMSGLRDKLNAMTEQFNIISRRGEIIQPVLDADRRHG
jgi:cell division protein FtsB